MQSQSETSHQRGATDRKSETDRRNRRITVTRIGGSEVLEACTEPLQAPPPGHARVRVVAAGVSYGDILLRNGVIPGGPKAPFVPGFDITGVVDAVGDGVTGLAEGDRVVALIRKGGYAEQLTVPAERLVPVPEETDLVRLAAASLNYFIALQMLNRVAGASAGASAGADGAKRVLVHGAAGGVGTAVLQLARTSGVEVYGTCSAAKHDLVASLGGHPIDYRTENFVDVIRSLPDGGGVDAALDPIGGAHFNRSYATLRRGGILIGYGQSAALVDGKAKLSIGARGMLGGIFGPKLLPDGRRTLFYNAWSLEKKQPHAYREDLLEVVRLLDEGTIAPVIADVLPLSQAGQAHKLLEESAVRGKIVLVTDEEAR
ncbi:medium chain dehydrogenase/reductase family protein [Streptomyces sp. NPDC002851]